MYVSDLINQWSFDIQQTLESTWRNQATPLLSQVKRLLRTAPHHLASSIGIDQSEPSLLFPNCNSSSGSRYKGLYPREIISTKEECCRTLHVSTVTCSKQQNTSFSTALLLNRFGIWFPWPPISNKTRAYPSLMLRKKQSFGSVYRRAVFWVISSPGCVGPYGPPETNLCLKHARISHSYDFKGLDRR